MGSIDDVMNMVTRLVCDFLLEMSSTTQHIKFKFEQNKFRIRTVYNSQTRISF